uniref:Uncharacterized protein n=2 Tax=Chromera velia CCMP2878 TaxID=1169474 RepID=A0A0K6S8H8_9ALVE|eukprot:Cvel_25701.t1-p1 / transcript=Cvel_25701.t1 / gene=Cvel_25701 / organism=Chromera_velia_CCMP2878 / gene_product=hypothetical protein / transcript_product=hypothetical protein / location=Cvel_scaffold2949:1963-2820(+) / protein_length=286 / sequence_SO=supercontig / SO=protein_coding / is_pseudo=false
MARFGRTNEFCYVPIGPTEMRGEAGLKRAGGVSTYELVLKMPAHWSYGNRLFGGLEGPEARRCIATKDGKTATIDCVYIRGVWLDSDRVAVSVWAGVSLWDRQTEDPLRPPIVNPVPFPCVKQRRRPFKPLQLRFPRYKGIGDGDHVLIETDRILWLRTRGWDENHAEPRPRPHTRFECIYREKRLKRVRVGDNESSSSSNSSSSSSAAALPPPPPPPAATAAATAAAAPAGLPHGEDESDNDSETEARDLYEGPFARHGPTGLSLSQLALLQRKGFIASADEDDD